MENEIKAIIIKLLDNDINVDTLDLIVRLLVSECGD